MHEQALSREAVYKHCIVKVWVALPHAEGSTEMKIFFRIYLVLIVLTQWYL